MLMALWLVFDQQLDLVQHVGLEGVSSKGREGEVVTGSVAIAEHCPVEQSGAWILGMLQRVDLEIVPDHVVVLVGTVMDEAGEKLVPILVRIIQFGHDAFRYVLHGLPVVVEVSGHKMLRYKSWNEKDRGGTPPVIDSSLKPSLLQR